MASKKKTPLQIEFEKVARRSVLKDEFDFTINELGEYHDSNTDIAYWGYCAGRRKGKKIAKEAFDSEWVEIPVLGIANQDNK